VSTSFDYAGLRTLAEGALADSSVEFEAIFDTLLNLGEDMCVVDLALDIWKGNSGDITITANNQAVPMPAGFLKILTLFLVVDNDRVMLPPRTHEYLLAYWPSVTEEAQPRYFSPYSTTQFYVAPTPDADYPAIAYGIKRPDSLAANHGGTWLSQNAGRLLYLATLVNIEQFDIADERVEMWKKEYAEELGRKRVELRHLITPEFMLPES
jgi:hypothetical protein